MTIIFPCVMLEHRNDWAVSDQGTGMLAFERSVK